MEEMVMSLQLENKAIVAKNLLLEKEHQKLAKKISAAELSLEQYKDERDRLVEQLLNAGQLLSKTAKEEIVREALAKAFTKPQLDRLLNKKKTHWTEDDFGHAAVLFCISARAFNVIRLKLKYPLPSPSAITRYFSHLHCAPGLLTTVLRMMEAMSHQLTELERIVNITLDEVKIDRDFVYYARQDRVIGQVSYAHVFYARSLFGNWGNEIFYDYNIKATPELVNFIATKLHEANFRVIGWSSDLGPSNQGLHTALGVSVDNQVVRHPITKKKMFIMTDAPHDMKNARNRLFDLGVVLNPRAPKKQHRVASKEPLEELVELGPQQGEWNHHKLTHRHLQVKGMSRQNVRDAAETMSNTTGTKLKGAGEEGLINSPNWLVSIVYHI